MFQFLNKPQRRLINRKKQISPEVQLFSPQKRTTLICLGNLNIMKKFHLDLFQDIHFVEQTSAWRLNATMLTSSGQEIIFILPPYYHNLHFLPFHLLFISRISFISTVLTVTLYLEWLLSLV